MPTTGPVARACFPQFGLYNELTEAPGCSVVGKTLAMMNFSVAIHWSSKWMFPKIVGFPPKSSILIGFSITNHPFWGTPIFGNTQMDPDDRYKWNQKGPCINGLKHMV